MLLETILRGYPEIQDANFTESAVTLLSWKSGRSCAVSRRRIPCMLLMESLAALDSGVRASSWLWRR